MHYQRSRLGLPLDNAPVARTTHRNRAKQVVPPYEWKGIYSDRSLAVIYAAGFVDGEGCLSAGSQKSGVRTLRMQVTNRIIEPLHLMQALWGGSVLKKSIKNQDHAPAFYWQISATKALRAARELLPFLIIKQDVAKACIEYQERLDKGFSGAVLPFDETLIREAIRCRITELNRTGRTRYTCGT